MSGLMSTAQISFGIITKNKGTSWSLYARTTPWSIDDQLVENPVYPGKIPGGHCDLDFASNTAKDPGFSVMFELKVMLLGIAANDCRIKTFPFSCLIVENSVYIA